MVNDVISKKLKIKQNMNKWREIARKVGQKAIEEKLTNCFIKMKERLDEFGRILQGPEKKESENLCYFDETFRDKKRKSIPPQSNLDTILTTLITSTDLTHYTEFRQLQGLGNFFNSSHIKKPICEGNLGIERTQMPQVIDIPISKPKLKELIRILSNKALKDPFKSILNQSTCSERDIKGLKDSRFFFEKRQIIIKEIEKKDFEKCGLITLAADPNQNAQIYLSFIYLFLKKGKDVLIQKLNKMLEFLNKKGTNNTEVSIKEYLENDSGSKRDKFIIKQKSITLDSLVPTQNEVKSEKTYKFCNSILHTIFSQQIKSLYDSEKKNKDIKKLLLIIEGVKAFRGGFSTNNIIEILREIIKGKNGISRGISVSKDNKIIDGHHRWSTCKLLQYLFEVFFVPLLTNKQQKLVKDIFIFNKNIQDSGFIVQQVVNKTFKEYYCEMMLDPLVYSASVNDTLIEKSIYMGRDLQCPTYGGSRKKGKKTFTKTKYKRLGTIKKKRCV